MIRELAEVLAPKRVQCSQLLPVPRAAFELYRCPGMAIMSTPVCLGAPHPRPLCANCAQGLAYVLEHDTVYSRIVKAAGGDPLELAGELRRGAERGLS